MSQYQIFIIIYLAGMLLFAMQNIAILKVRYADKNPGPILGLFFREEWNTLIVSGIGLVLVNLFWYIVQQNGVKVPLWLDQWGVYLFVLVLGYAFPRIIYKYLGTAEKALQDRIDKTQQP